MAERNTRAIDSDLGVAFSELPQTEKDKDISQVRVALDLFQLDLGVMSLSLEDDMRTLDQQIDDIDVGRFKMMLLQVH